MAKKVNAVNQSGKTAYELYRSGTDPETVFKAVSTVLAIIVVCGPLFLIIATFIHFS